MRRRLALAAAILAVTASCQGGDGSAPPPSPTTAPDGSPAPTPTQERLRLRLAKVAGLQQPLALAVRSGDPAVYVAQKTGQLVALRDGRTEVVLDLSTEVSVGGEQGLLGLAFSPDGAFLYVNYTDRAGDTHVVEYEMGGDGVAEGSRREVLAVDQPFGNHNGGHLAFGPDGYLYVGLGDGGSGGDPLGNGQDLGTLLGTMLRIDPRPAGGRPYTVPPDNPFAGREGARPEIWAFGLRNPWRYSFDRATGDLWIADVGQLAREEVNRQPAGSTGGENYGWNRLEGTLPFEGDPPPDAVAPVFDYGRDTGGTVIGGFVYRGTAIPALRGAYVFGDFFSDRLMVLRPRDGDVRFRRLPVGVPNLSSFGEDLDGELYVLSLSEGLFRLEAG
jgi:glucose/arabinose dehydrogenase